MSYEEIVEPASQVAEGDRYYNGEGVEKDLAQAAKWYEKAANQGFALGQYYLGYCYYTGEGVEQDFTQAAQWYIKAAEQGNAKAQQKLSVCYFSGEGVAQDFSKAYDWCKKSAEQGRAYAQYMLGVFYFNGYGTDQDLKQAALMYTKAAEQGDIDAQYSLGDCYLDGDGVEEDHEKAVFWYAKAAEQDHPQAQFKLAYRYLKGDGIECDTEKAIYWYGKSAEQGFDRAQFSLGICYGNGEGTDQDFEKARYWFTKAAEQGHADSCVELAQIYFKGEGAEYDFGKGLHWFREAAKAGEPKLMLHFGQWLLDRDNCTPDEKDEGLKWIDKAADADEHDEDEIIWQARWILAEIYEYGLYKIDKDLLKAISFYELLVENGDNTAAVYAQLLSKGKEDPVCSRGWSTKHLVSKILSEDFPEFDAQGALYERKPDYSDMEFTGEQKDECLPVAEKILQFSDLVKRESVLALAEKAESEDDVYFKTALKMASGGIRADLFDEVIKVLYVKEKPAGAALLKRFIIHRGIYLIIRGDFTTQKLRVLLASCYLPRLLLPGAEKSGYKMTFNYLFTHREIPKLYFETLNDFYAKVLPDPDMMQRFLFFAYNRSKYIAEENPDIEPAFDAENFEMYMYGDAGRQVLVITMPKCGTPPDSYQIAIPAARQKAGYFTCELSVDPFNNEPCFIFGEWNAEKKHSNYGKIDINGESCFAKMAVDIAYGKPLKEPPIDRGNMEFDTPDLELYCEKCGTTNFFYDDNEPPYLCDSCGAELIKDAD
ncbi:MAG: hypothetical protein FWC03_01755 [Treponema sp.]|nr:hypothetical protein [Treponema sp.]